MQRNTRQRQAILDAVLSSSEHPTAEQVLSRARASLPQISRATVYNGLNQLVSEGMVRKIEYPGEPDRFDRRTLPHAHFRCDVCGRVFDYDERIELARAPCSTNEFEVTGFDIYLRGICKSCRERISPKSDNEATESETTEHEEGAGNERPHV